MFRWLRSKAKLLIIPRPLSKFYFAFEFPFLRFPHSHSSSPSSSFSPSSPNSSTLHVLQQTLESNRRIAHPFLPLVLPRLPTHSSVG